LPRSTRDRFEAAFGHDFTHVRLHDDGDAHAATAALSAEAFTSGTDIWFAEGRYAPGTAAGDRLLAHELTHVVQLDDGRLSQGSAAEVAGVGDPAEAHAYGNENAVLARLPAEFAVPVAGFDVSQAVAPRRTPVATRIHRRQPAASPTVGEAPVPVEEDVPAEPVAPTLEQLVSDLRSVTPDVAIDLIERVAAYQPLGEAVAHLDDQGLLDGLFRSLGTRTWSDPSARAAMLRILPLRAAEKNEATIGLQVATGLLEADLRVSGEEARMVYEILRAMPDDQRASFLATPEGQLAFEKLPDRKRPGLHLAKEFAFHDEDLDALLVELDRLEVWAPEQEPWLRALFWMAVQSGRADDPRVVELVTHNWDSHGQFFAEQGLRLPCSESLARLLTWLSMLCGIQSKAGFA